MENTKSEFVDPRKHGTLATIDHLRGMANIIEQRSGTHGDAFENLEDIARRWTNYLRKKFGIEITLDAGDVGYFMVEMKLSRATYGDNAEIDHPADICGYAAIWASHLKCRKAKEKNQRGARRKKSTNDKLHAKIEEAVVKAKLTDVQE